MTTTGTEEEAPATVEAWVDKMTRLRSRKMLQRDVTFYDEEAVGEVEKAQEHLDRVLGRVSREAQAKLSKDGGPYDDAAVKAVVDVDEVVVEARSRLDAAEKAERGERIVMTVRGLGSDVYEELQAAHPPTADQEKRGETYNVSTFAPALIAACAIDPMTEDEARELMKVLNQGEASLLFTSCVTVNQAARASLGKG